MSLAEGFSWEVSLIGLSLTAFTLTNILTKSFKHKTDWLLCLWLILLNVPFLHIVLSHINLAFPGLYRYTNPTLNLLQGPILYLYVRMLTSNEQTRLRKSELWHFAPFGLFYFLFIFMSHPEPMMPRPDRINTNVGPVAGSGLVSYLDPLIIHFGFINVLFFIAYSIVTIYTLRRHQKNISGIFSQNDNQISLKWIYALPGMVAVLVLFNVLAENFFKSGYDPLTLQMLSFLCFLILLCFFGIKQKPVFQFRQTQVAATVEIVENESVEPNDSQENDEPESNSVSDLFITQSIEKMQSYMQREKPYLDPDFSVYTLADALSIPRRTLSQVLNVGLSKNFYQYVNEFRIEEVKLQLESQDNKSTILDIAFQAGFKSKSSFNSLFKQHCNLTPSQYRKMIKQQSD